MKDDRLYLTHILECITKIETYTEGGRAAFIKEPMIQDAVIRNLEIVGEATKNLSLDFRQAHPEVGWRRAMALRNILIHNYVAVNVPRVWTDVMKTLPKLKEQVEALLSANGDSGPDGSLPKTTET